MQWLKFACKLLVAGLAILLFVIGYGILPNRWYHTLYVYSGSMSPAINAGDVILITPPTTQVVPGMVITLRVDESLVTHRVVAALPGGQFITRGDANNAADEWGQSKVTFMGVYRARIPYLGYLFSEVQQLIKTDASGAWFVDQELLNMQFACCTGNWILPTAPRTAMPSPTAYPTGTPTGQSTAEPTITQTPPPTGTLAPPESTTEPTTEPTLEPTSEPTIEPTPLPTDEPTLMPTSTTAPEPENTPSP